MSKTKHQFNRRKSAIDLLKRVWKKEGFDFKKAVGNTITFRNQITGEKKRVNLDY